MKNTKLIGFCGHAGAGKNYLANFVKQIAEQSGWIVIESPFAKPIKEMIDTLLYNQIPESEETHQGLYGNQRDAVPPGFDVSYRVMCQQMGIMCRGWKKDFWIQESRYFSDAAWMREWEASHNNSYSDTPRLYLITDVRFENEVDAIRNEGGYVFKVTRPGYNGQVGIPGHPSETEMDNISDRKFNLKWINDMNDKESYATMQSVLDNLGILNNAPVPAQAV